MRPKNDVQFFEELVRQTGGPDTYWAQSVRTAMEKEDDPLREEHRAETRLRVEARQRELVDTLSRYRDKRAQAPNAGALKHVEREEKKELDGVFNRHELESFVSWAQRRRMTIERTEGIVEERKLAMKPQAQEQAPAVKRGRGR
jgi:hypothetical protein